MMNHTLGRSNMAVLQQLSFPEAFWARSIGRQGAMRLRFNECAQLLEPKVTEQNQMLVRLDLPNVSHLELTRLRMTGQESR